MIRMRIDELRPGMRVARPVYSEDGQILLQAGVELKKSFIDRLRAKGFYAIYVDDGESAGENVDLVISDELRSKVTGQVKTVFEKAVRGEGLDLAGIVSTIDSLVDEVLANRHVVYSLSEIRSVDNYTFAHSVNVCVLSCLLGLHFGFSRDDLRELALGAILHDIGKVKIAPELLAKTGRLDIHEMEEMKRHPRLGFEMLRDCEGISLRTAHVAYQHHERLDGRGYPRGLKGDAIHPFARIVMVVDTFDAMTSERVYRRAVPQHLSLALIGRMAGRQFPLDVVRALQQRVAKYPVGSRVRLDTGEMGVVVDVDRLRPDRPRVRLLEDAKGKPISGFVLIDLGLEKNRQVSEVIGG